MLLLKSMLDYRNCILHNITKRLQQTFRGRVKYVQHIVDWCFNVKDRCWTWNVSCQSDTSWTEILELNFRFSGDEVSCYLMVGFGYNRGRNLILDQKSIVKDICDRQFSSPGIYHLHHTNINGPLSSLPFPVQPLLKLSSEYNCLECKRSENWSRAGSQSLPVPGTKCHPCEGRKAVLCWKWNMNIKSGCLYDGVVVYL